MHAEEILSLVREFLPLHACERELCLFSHISCLSSSLFFLLLHLHLLTLLSPSLSHLLSLTLTCTCAAMHSDKSNIFLPSRTISLSSLSFPLATSLPPILSYFSCFCTHDGEPLSIVSPLFLFRGCMWKKYSHMERESLSAHSSLIPLSNSHACENPSHAPFFLAPFSRDFLSHRLSLASSPSSPPSRPIFLVTHLSLSLSFISHMTSKKEEKEERIEEIDFF